MESVRQATSVSTRRLQREEADPMSATRASVADTSVSTIIAPGKISNVDFSTVYSYNRKVDFNCY